MTHHHVIARPHPTASAHLLKSANYDLKPKNAKKVEVDSVSTEHIGAGEDVLQNPSSICNLEIWRKFKHIPAIL